MIISESTPEELQKQIIDNTEELNKIKSSYKSKITMYSKCTETIKELTSSDDNQMYDKEKLAVIEKQMNEKKDVLDKQQEIIEKALSTLEKIKENTEAKELIYEYNNYYKQIEDVYKNNNTNINTNVGNLLKETAKKQSEPVKETQEEDVKIKNNSVLLVSELQNKVILPYTCAEVEEIINDKNNNYNTPQEVIENIFTRKLTDYRDTMFSRYKEAYNLAFYRCNRSRFEAMKLGFEVCRKRFLHPAIISACKTMEDLDVYLDCLNKNELEEFKIFEIKYEIPPMLPQYNKLFALFHRSEKYNY